ncbi:MAG TPA: ABC transporter ATP-binding protein [Longimicrobiaceae bacterium]|nr:ABC transporter ATP-binding protein [Longimicrobiaceae bacterium]
MPPVPLTGPPLLLAAMIQLQGVTKEFRPLLARDRSPVRALDGVTLSIGRGDAVGIIGLNGAGKSTLLRILLGYVRPTSGTAHIEGEPPRRYVERHGVAYVPERVAIQRDWEVRQALRAYAMLGELGPDAWSRVDRAIERLGLGSLAQRKVGALSKGNLQRLAIAQAILADRKLMVLDEPTDGLDPVWIAELRGIVREWREADPERTVVLASHHLPEVEQLVDSTVLLHNGRIEGPVQHGGSGGDLEAAFLRRLETLEEARP